MDLNIRKFPDEVAKEAKIQAIDLGLKLQEWVVAAVKFALTSEARFREFAKEARDGNRLHAGVRVQRVRTQMAPRKSEQGTAPVRKVQDKVLEPGTVASAKPDRIRTAGVRQDTCPYHRDQVLVQSTKKTYRAECPQCHEDFEKRAGFSYEGA